MKQIHLEKFQGPLDVLLLLIESKKLDITEIALAEVTEQFLKVLESQENKLFSEELADFLLVASRLLLIKSRVLLPLFEWEDDEDGNIADQLRMYKLYADAAKVIDEMSRNELFSFSRPYQLLQKKESEFHPPASMNLSTLSKVMQEIISDLEPLGKLPEKIYRKVMSLHEKIDKIDKMVFERTRLSFSSVLEGNRNRSDIIVSFLAILELVKRERITVCQTEPFMEMEIIKI